MRNSERLKICHYMCVFRTEISQFRFWRPVTGEAPTEHISYSDTVWEVGLWVSKNVGSGTLGSKKCGKWDFQDAVSPPSESWMI